jgi:hypothetical protein
MKTIIVLVIVLLLAVVPEVRAQFEGEMNLKTTRTIAGTPMNALITVLMKGEMLNLKVKDESETGKDASIIYRGDKKSLWIVNDKEKNYFEIPMKESDEEETPVGKKHTREKADNVSVEKTGKTATILGYPCEEYIIQQDDEAKDLWATTKLGDVYEGFMKSFGQFAKRRPGGMNDNLELEVIKMKIFPLKSTTTTRGVVTSTEEITKIEKRTLAASLFEAPTGYKKQSFDLDMNTMMKGMRGKMKNGAGAPGDNEDVRKMMEEMKEKMKKMQEKNNDGADSTKENE